MGTSSSIINQDTFQNTLDMQENIENAPRAEKVIETIVGTNEEEPSDDMPCLIDPAESSSKSAHKDGLLERTELTKSVEIFEFIAENIDQANSDAKRFISLDETVNEPSEPLPI